MWIDISRSNSTSIHHCGSERVMCVSSIKMIKIERANFF